MRILVDALLAHIDGNLRSLDWSLATVEEEDYAEFARCGPGELTYLVGLDLTPRDFGLSLNPSVSVKHERIATLAAQFYGLPEGASMVGSSLADLFEAKGRSDGSMPRWSVFPDDDLATVAQNLLSDLGAHGIPYMERFSSLSDLIVHLESGVSSVVDRGHLAIAYAELGNFEKCSSILALMTAEVNQQPTFVSDQMEAFIARLKSHYQMD